MARLEEVWILVTLFGIAFGAATVYNEDEWEPVFRIYSGDGWNSYDDYISQARSAQDGSIGDAQFRSYKLEQWSYLKIQKVRVEIFDAGNQVAQLEFEANQRNSTNFFSARTLKSSTFDDLPTATATATGVFAGDGFSFEGCHVRDKTPNRSIFEDLPTATSTATGVFAGDGFSFEGDGNYRHWVVSGRHVGNCRTDDGWLQIVDKPKPGLDLYMCGYENVAKFPAIMYSKSKRKTKWSDRRNVGYADMMQVSVSYIPFPTPQPAPQTPDPMLEYYRQQHQLMLQQQQQQEQQQPAVHQTNMWLEMKKK